MKFVVLFFSFLTISCTSGNCRNNQDRERQEKGIPPKEVSIETSSKSKVLIYKYDGSLQCGMGKAIPVLEMQKELGSIKVSKAENKADNLMHIQMCGAPTGRANVYEIDAQQLEEAKKLGFREWTFD